MKSKEKKFRLGDSILLRYFKESRFCFLSKNLWKKNIAGRRSKESSVSARFPEKKTKPSSYVSLNNKRGVLMP